MDDKEFDSNSQARETEFPAVVKFSKAGQKFWGKYIGTEMVPQKPPKNPLRAHVFELLGYDGATFEKNKKTIEVKEGDIVSISGQRLDRALQPADIGAKCRIVYDGQEPEGRNGNNPAHLFSVNVIPLKTGDLASTVR